MKFIIFIILLLFQLNTNAQGFDWWNNNVHWDGVTNWVRYMKVAPGTFGPNALPVPQVSGGLLDSTTHFSSTIALHRQRGDFTQNLNLYAHIKVAKNFTMEYWYVPIEHFVMSHEIKTERNVYYQFYNKHFASGDIILNTNLALQFKNPKPYRLGIRSGFKYAPSATPDFGVARFTNSPGYHFDFNYSRMVGKNKKTEFRSMVGFLAFQTNLHTQFQDDALLLGFAFKKNWKHWVADAQLASYLGYMETLKDKPLVVRLNTEYKMDRINIIIKAQQGLRHFKYTTLEIGVKYKLKNKEN